jgi:hypothetical protein
MIVRACILTALGLALSLPTAAAAQSVPATGPGTLAGVTTAYFAALGEADAAALARTTSSTFHIVRTDGKHVTPGEFLGAIYAHHLDASTPRQTVKIGTSSITGNKATENVFLSSFDYRLLDGQQWLERDTSDHQLTFTQTASGTWLLDEDHVTTSNHYE